MTGSANGNFRGPSSGPNHIPNYGPDPSIRDTMQSVRDTEIRSTFANTRASLVQVMVTKEFYKRDDWVSIVCEVLFKVRERGSTIKAECYYGLVHFISCVYVLAIIPQLLTQAGYYSSQSVVVTACCSGFGSIIAGLFANLPFVLAPPTIASIYLSGYLTSRDLDKNVGSAAVMISGAILMVLGYYPLHRFVCRIIPLPIQVGTAIGIGLLTALAGAVEVNFVVRGTNNLLMMGNITPEILLSLTGVIIICATQHYHVKGSFAISLIFCAIVWWGYSNTWPKEIVSLPSIDHIDTSGFNNPMVLDLTSDLLFLYILFLSGLISSLSNLAQIAREDGATPRGRWVFIIAGLMTVMSASLNGAPILVSPESAAAVKVGAKTGLSAVVCGFLFLFSCFFAPIFENMPHPSTSPVLFCIGILLFQNVGRLDFRIIEDSGPAFVILFFIPFTYSLIQGVIAGYVIYLSLTFLTGTLQDQFKYLVTDYVPCLGKYIPTSDENTRIVGRLIGRVIGSKESMSHDPSVVNPQSSFNSSINPMTSSSSSSSSSSSNVPFSSSSSSTSSSPTTPSRHVVPYDGNDSSDTDRDRDGTIKPVKIIEISPGVTQADRSPSKDDATTTTGTGASAGAGAGFGEARQRAMSRAADPDMYIQMGDDDDSGSYDPSTATNAKRARALSRAAKTASIDGVSFAFGTGFGEAMRRNSSRQPIDEVPYVSENETKEDDVTQV